MALTPEFQAEVARFEALLKETPFTILVWGSGASNESAFEKRRKVRDHLSARFGERNVLMSEDIELEAMTLEYGARVAEAIQTLAIDAIISLDFSIGPHSELLEFEDEILGKAIVFVPVEHRTSKAFASIAWEILKVDYVSSPDNDNCEEIRRKANHFAQALRYKKAKQRLLTAVSQKA